MTLFCRVANFCSDDPDDMELQPEVTARQPERRAEEDLAVKQLKGALQPLLGKLLAQLLEELKQK